MHDARGAPDRVDEVGEAGSAPLGLICRSSRCPIQTMVTSLFGLLSHILVDMTINVGV